MPPKSKAKIIIEVMYKADYCLPCFYMDEMVRSVLPDYADRVEYRRVDFLKGAGKERFLDVITSYSIHYTKLYDALFSGSPKIKN